MVSIIIALSALLSNGLQIDVTELEKQRNQLEAAGKFTLALDVATKIIDALRLERNAFLVQALARGGVIASQAGDKRLTEKYLMEAIELRREIGKKDTSYFQLLQSAQLALSRTENYEALDKILPDLIEMIEKQFGKKGLLSVTYRRQAADVLNETRRFDAAFEMYSQLIVECREIGKPAIPTRFSILQSLSELYLSRGQLINALACADEMVELYRSGGMPDAFRFDMALLVKGNCLSMIGRGPEAISCYEEAAKLYESKPTFATDYLDAQIQISTQYTMNNSFNAALDSIDLGIAHAKKYPNADKLSLIKLLSDKAQIYNSLGRSNLSLEFLNEAKKILDTLEERQDGTDATARINIGTAFTTCGFPKLGEELYRRALAVFEKMDYVSEQDLGLAYFCLANSLSNQGRYAEAIEFSEKAEKALANSKHPSAIWATAINAYLDYSLGNLDSAIARYLVIQKSKTISGNQNDGALLNVYSWLRRIYLLKNDVSNATENINNEVRIRREILNNLLKTGSEQNTVSFATKFQLDSIVSLIRTGKFSPAQVYNWMLLLRGVASELQMQLHTTQLASQRNPEVKALRESLTELKSRKSALELVPPRDKTPIETNGMLRTLQTEIEKRSAELNKIAGQKATFSNVTVSQIQSQLRNDQVILDFVEFEPEDFTKPFAIPLPLLPNEIGVFIIDNKSVQYKLLGRSSAIKATLVKYKTQFQLSQSLASSSKQLYLTLIKPIENSIKGKNHLVIVPSGIVTFLPFESLTDSTGKYLIEKFQISYLESSQSVLMKSQTKSSNPPVVFSSPKFDLSETEILSTNRTPSAPQFRGAEGMKFVALPGTESEGKLISKKISANLFTGANASESNLYKIKSPKILHLATHGFFFSVQPQEINADFFISNASPTPNEDPMSKSGIVLSGANNPSEMAKHGYDGWATALEISEMDLSGTDLVVLSACETGKGTENVGEGVFGLRRAFRFAGAKTIIMSLLKVPDESTKQLMTLFYDNYSKNIGKLQALRKAQMTMLKNPKTKHPINWAGFVLIGST